jgi:hypothetical protein
MRQPTPAEVTHICEEVARAMKAIIEEHGFEMEYFTLLAFASEQQQGYFVAGCSTLQLLEDRKALMAAYLANQHNLKQHELSEH